MNDELEDGLRRARDHLGRATLEALEAARVLLDVSLRASGMRSVSPHSLAGEIGRSLDALISSLQQDKGFALPAALAEPLAEALEAEIGRWQARSRTDDDARPVLRAFLGLRELLWELGVRSRVAPEPRDTQPESSNASQAPKKTRVQRFDIES